MKDSHGARTDIGTLAWRGSRALGSTVALAVVTVACGGLRARPVTAPTSGPTTIPRLTATRFVAFGDSITEGYVQRCPGAATTVRGQMAPAFHPLLLQVRAQPSPTAYPAKLQALLAGRYTTQTISMINEGAGGEDVQTGAADLGRVLTTDAPQVLLLLEGIKSLNQKHAEGIPIVVDALRRMIREARGRGLTVFVATLLPERPGGCRAYDLADEKDDIIPANVEIRGLVGTEGAVLVDLYQAFNGRTATLIGEDGLHPSEAGYQVIAETFFAAIRQHLEAEE